MVPKQNNFHYIQQPLHLSEVIKLKQIIIIPIIAALFQIIFMFHIHKLTYHSNLINEAIILSILPMKTLSCRNQPQLTE